MEDRTSDGAQTFAAYLAKHYVAKKGFVTGTVPEAGGLATACDIVLTRSDGMSFQVICMIDCEAHPGKRFEMSRDAIDEIGKQCLKYSGTVSGNKMPISIQIMEIVRTPVTRMDHERLKVFIRKSMFSKVVISAWIVDTAKASVWSNALFNGRLVGRSFIEQLMRNPRIPDAELSQPAPAVSMRAGLPILTCVLLMVLAAVFAGEHIYGIGPSTGLLAPSIRTLIALGGLNQNLVLQSGEWYRIFSATLLHGDLIHLLLNGLALCMAGMALENLVGRVWFFALFVIGAVGGSLMSLALNPPTVVSVGASGAIMGLLVAAFVCSFRFPSGTNRTQIQVRLLQVLIPSLIPIAVSRTGQHIDFAGHLGGALSGALVGVVMLKTWHAANPLPRFIALAAAVSIAGFAAFAYAFFPLTRQYQSHALEMLLIPSDQVPKTNSEAQSRSSDLVARYPRDPRPRLFLANSLLEKRDLAGAERELRAGLAEEQILKIKFSRDLESRMRTLLALVLLDQGRPADAKTAAQPVCLTSVSGQMREALNKARLCD